MDIFTTLAVLIALSLGVSLIDSLALGRDRSSAWFTRERMPRELRKATLLLNEEPISTTRPVPLHGIPDQVFLTWRGTLVCVDTKTRDRGRVYESDILQLSIYRTILRNTQSRRVADYGYVRLVHRNGNGERRVQYRRVFLLKDRQVASMAQS